MTAACPAPGCTAEQAVRRDGVPLGWCAEHRRGRLRTAPGALTLTQKQVLHALGNHYVPADKYELADGRMLAAAVGKRLQELAAGGLVEVAAKEGHRRTWQLTAAGTLELARLRGIVA